MRAITYAGFQISDYFKIQKISRSLLPPRQISYLEVPERHGAYFTGSRYGVRKMDVQLTVLAKTPTDYLDTIRFLAFCMDIDQPTELIISDEPDKFYFAILSGDTEMVNSLMRVGSGTISFLCLDPFAYSVDTKTIYPSENMFLFQNNGTTTTFPIFTVNFQNDASFVSFTSPDGVILIGNPSEPDQITLPKTQTMLNDHMGSTLNWVDAGNVLDNGRVDAGSVVSVSEGIQANDYGTGTAGAQQWHGPAIRQDLSQNVKDFEVRARLNFISEDGTSKLDGNRVGRLEIYLFDQNGGKIGKMVMRDSYTQYEFNIPEIYIGNTTFLQSEPKAPAGKKKLQKLYKTYKVKKGDTWASIAKQFHMSDKDLASLNKDRTKDALKVGRILQVYDKTITKWLYPSHVGVYNDFYGEFVLSRVGTKWYAEVSRIDNGKKNKTIKKTYYDTDGIYSSAYLSYIVIHFAQYDTSVPVDVMRVSELKVIQHNTDTIIDVPQIFSSGDELEVNLSDSSVWLNGDLFMQNVDVASTFFTVDEGETQVKVNTDDTQATFSAEFTERYL